MQKEDDDNDPWQSEALQRASKKKIFEPELTSLFNKLNSIKKPSALSFFKKRVDPTEEEVMTLLSSFLDKTAPIDYCQFLLINQTEIEFFFALTFNPLNRNKKLTEQCIKLAIKLISMIGQTYIDLSKTEDSGSKKQMGVSQFTTPGHTIELKNISGLPPVEPATTMGEAGHQKPKGTLSNVFSRACCFLSTIFVSSPKHLSYKMKSDKLKVFKSLESRLADVDQKTTGKITDAYTLLKEQMKIETEGSNITSTLIVAQSWFEIVGEILDKSTSGNKLGLNTETFFLELMTLVKQKNKLFDLLDHYFDILLSFEDYQIGYMSVMEKNIAKYIANVLDGMELLGYFDLELFKQILGLINKLFQRRKKLFGVHENEEEFDYFMSGHSSSDDKPIPLVTSISRETEDEKTSFRSLQKMTGKLYLQMLEKTMNPAYRSLPDYNIFLIFNNDGQYVSYLEIFEAQHSQKLIKRVFAVLNSAVERLDKEPGLKDKLLSLLKVKSCVDKQCTCFVNDFLGILFKLAMKCPQSVTSSLTSMFLELMKGVVRYTDCSEKVLDCYLKSSIKMFRSLLSQNLQTIEKMTVQLATPGEVDSPGLSPSPDKNPSPESRNTQGLRTRRFNLFFDCIMINGNPTRLTKELCEAVLLLHSDASSVKKYLGGEDIKVDLELDEFGYVTTQDVVELVRDRWQVRLLTFRTQLLDIGAQMLKEIYNTQNMTKIFAGFWEFFTDLNSKRGCLLHKFYLGYVVHTFCSHFNLSNYKVNSFQKYVYIFDIYLKGLGYYDRDNRLPLPISVQKGYVEQLLVHLRLKWDGTDLRLTVLQLVICLRLEQMFIRDPPILKALLPLMFDIVREVLVNFDKVNWANKEVAEGLVVILEELGAGDNSVNVVLCLVVRLLFCVITTGHAFSKFPVVLRPQVKASGRFLPAGGFEFAKFGNIVDWLLNETHLQSLISLVDKAAVTAHPQVELAKYLTFVAFYCPSVLEKIFESLLAKCLVPCLDEIFKVRMKLILSLLTLENNQIAAAPLLNLFLDRFEALLVGNSKSLSAPKKQWFLTVLAKWVYLTTQSEVSIGRTARLVAVLRQTDDEYLQENTTILESYLAAFKGLYSTGSKELRMPSIFDENNMLPRKNMDDLFRMLDRFIKDEPMEEEMRLMQHYVELNLLDFLDENKRRMSFEKLLDLLLAKIKPPELKWMYLFDSRNIVLYSLAETAPRELCIIKRHIAGKTTWFLQEDTDGLHISKSGLDQLAPDQALPTPSVSVPEGNLLVRLLNTYRAEPEVFDYFSSKSLDADILALKSNKQTPQRTSDFESLARHLKVSWEGEEGSLPAPLLLRSQPSSQALESDQESLDSHRRGSNISGRTLDPRASESMHTQRPRKDCLGSRLALQDSRVRFLLQAGLYTQGGPGQGVHTDFWLISPEADTKERFKNSLNFIDRTRIVNCFKVGILFIGSDQEREDEILGNAFPEGSLFAAFVSHLGERQAESVYAKSLGSDRIEYQVGPLIPRKAQSTFEVKRIVGNVPTLLVWTQNLGLQSLENIKSKFNKDIIIVEELPNALLRVRSLRRLDETMLEAVFKPDGLMSLECLLKLIHSYIFSSQMEINPKIFSSLDREYKTISPFLEARKKKIRELTVVYSAATRPLGFDTLCDLVFAKKF